MVKSIRLSNENHKRLITLQGRIQYEMEETVSMDDVIDILVTSYKIGSKKNRK